MIQDRESHKKCQEILAAEAGLTDREIDFVEDLVGRLERGVLATTKQVAWLDRILEKLDEGPPIGPDDD